MSAAQPGWSPDGNWYWDGTPWNEAVSQDGKWRFDGNDWQPFSGQRTPMPAAVAAPPPPPPPPPAPVAAAVAVPSWVDPSEVERLEREKREREAIAAQPVAPLPPELDWRKVGERMQYSKTSRSGLDWQVGVTSVVIYIVLWWVCGPLSAIFPWLTRWSLFSKLITTFLSLGGVILAAVILRQMRMAAG